MNLAGSRRVWLAAFLVAGTSCAAQDTASREEASSGWTSKAASHARHYMVAAAHPQAVEAGLWVLRRGGNAIDAMVAVQLMLNLVEPASSGLGGGAFLMYYDARTRRVSAIDGREVAPSGASSSLFLGDRGEPLSFAQGRVGGRSVGVPGTPRLLEVAHVRHGKLPWKTLFEPAIGAAESGFPVSPRLHKVLASERWLADEPRAREYFFGDDGAPKPVGALLRNPAYAATLRAIARKGADAFYTGPIAADISRATRDHRNPGSLSPADLAGYRVRDVEALCGPYRSYRLCGMPPSSSGGIAVLQVLGELARFDMASVRPGSSQAVHLVTEAERLAFADRNRYVADDRFVDVPVSGLLDAAYLRERSALIRPERSMSTAKAGHPAGANLALEDDPTEEAAGTTQVTIVDGLGNVVSMTSTIESAFGSGIMVDGFLLNNELTDFSFVPVAEGRAVANSVAPGKRPRSSMAPFLVFDARSGDFEMALGSPGGALIIGYVAKALVALIDWKMDMQAAIDLPNFDSRNGPTEIEKGTRLAQIAPALKAMGHEVREIAMTSGTQGIRRVAGGLEGGADPRREGLARGR